MTPAPKMPPRQAVSPDDKPRAAHLIMPSPVQWQRDGVNIGQPSESYTLTADDVGRRISCALPDDKLRAFKLRMGDDQGAQMLGRVIIGTLAVCVLAVIVWGVWL